MSGGQDGNKFSIFTIKTTPVRTDTHIPALRKRNMAKGTVGWMGRELVFE